MAGSFGLSWRWQGKAGLPPALQKIGDEDPSGVEIQLG
jgi:hypothetical protein